MKASARVKQSFKEISWWLKWLLLVVTGLGGLSSRGWTQVPLTPPTFPATNVGSTSETIPVTVYTQQAGTISSFGSLTSGVNQLGSSGEFQVAGSANCAVGSSVNAGQSCELTVTFSPRYPGVRQGAVRLVATGGGELGRSASLSGIGQGSLPVLAPASISTVAGDAQYKYQGDGVPATSAPIFLPTGLAVDAAGDLFLCDSSNQRVRRVDAVTHLISTVAGDGNPGSGGDGGVATSAELNDPSGLALDGAGNLYIADSGNDTVRRVDAVTGIITTIAGKPGISGYTGVNGNARNATLDSPTGLALTPGGDLVIADSGNSAIRLLTLATGQIQTIAGTGTPGYNGDGVGTQSQLSGPMGVAVRGDGAIAIADLSNELVRLLDTSGNLTTVAGTAGQRGFAGDTLPATQAQFDSPSAVAFDPAGDLFIADSGNHRVRGIFGAPGIMKTLAGNNNSQTAGDGGPDDQASFDAPYALVFDTLGNIWVADLFENVVREISNTLDIQYPPMKVGKISPTVFGTMFNGGNLPLTLVDPASGNPSHLNQAQLDTNTPGPVCDQAPLAPTASCNMGIQFAPTQVSPSGGETQGSVTWLSDSNVVPVDTLHGVVLSVEPTTVAITSSANPGLLGQALTLTAKVASANSSLTGTVTFTEGSKPLCSSVAVSSDGTANCTIASLSLGTHSFIATYSGDNDDAASTSQPYTETIKQQPALALAVSSSPATVTSNVVLTLTAADQNGMPTGAVTFFDGGTPLATVPLNSAGTAQWSTATFAVGMHNLSAQYAGDSANAPGTSNAVAEQITPASTVTVIASNSSNPMIGTPLILTATVASNVGPAPAGTVQFKDVSGAGDSVLGSAPLGANGSASLSISTLPPGAHSIVAVYEGDTDDAGSRSTALPETVQATGLTLGSSANPAVSGQNVVLSAQLSAAGQTPATGMVIFHDGSASLASVPFSSSGTATFSTSTLSIGSHTITVTYAGDTNYGPAGGQLTEVVVGATTATTLTASANTGTYGQPLSLTVQVSSNGGPATGTVNFLAGTTVIGSAQLSSGGTAVYTLSNLTPGVDALTASYAGDGKADPSMSSPLTLVIKQTTALAVTANSNPAPTLSPVLFTATISDAGAAVATGSVSFSDGALAIGTATLDANGHATVTLPGLTAGSHSITATYAGDGADFPSTSAVYEEVVQKRPTTTTLTSSADPSNPQQMTLIAVVKGEGSVAPGGAVSFTSGEVTLGQATVDDAGVATITVIFEQKSEPVVASYAGDASYSPSQTTPATIVAGQAAQFTLALNAPDVTLVTHQHTTLTVNLGSVKGFTDTISLGCLGLPFAGTCTFTPSQVKLMPDGTATATLILDTGDPLGAGSGTSASLLNRHTTLLCGLPLGLLVGLLRSKGRDASRRKLGTLLMVAIAFALTIGVTGCSGLSTSGTPPGTYAFKVVGTGQGSGITQAQNITLVVTQ